MFDWGVTEYNRQAGSTMTLREAAIIAINVMLGGKATDRQVEQAVAALSHYVDGKEVKK